jgi:hypothetical protein
VNTYTSGFQGNPDVAVDGGDGFVVVWQSIGSPGTDTDSISVQGRRYDSNGAPVGGQFQVNTYTTGRQEGAVVSPDGGGGFVVVWESAENNYSAQAQRYDAVGPVGGQFQVNTVTAGSELNADVTSAGGGFVVTWWGGGTGTDTDFYGSIQAQRFDGSGAPVDAQFQVNASTTGAQYDPAVAANGAGEFMIAWVDDPYVQVNRDVRARGFDDTGTAAGPDLAVNTYTSSLQHYPTVGPDGAGGFVVIWESDGDNGTDTSGTSIQAQHFDASGTPVGGEFQINSYTTGDQRRPHAASDGAGGLVVVWQSSGSFGTDTDGSSIQGRRFDSTGAPFGGEFQVNSDTAGTQLNPSVAPDGGGGFVVAWQSTASSGSDTSSASIHARRFLSGAATIDASVPGTKLVVIDRNALPTPSAKVVSVSKLAAGIQKGPPEGSEVATPPGVTGTLELMYTGCGGAAIDANDPCLDAVPEEGRFEMPADWLVNKAAVAKYKNRDAPNGAGHVKVAVVKPAKVAKVVAKGLGDGPSLDLVGAGRPDATGVLVVLTVSNTLNGQTYRMCTRYEQNAIGFKALSGGLGRKLVARSGVPAPCP